MPVNAAFTNRTTNGTSTAYQLTQKTAIVELQPDSQMGSAKLRIQVASVNTAGKYQDIDQQLGVLRQPDGPRVVTLDVGWWIQLVLEDATPGVTNVNATITT